MSALIQRQKPASADLSDDDEDDTEQDCAEDEKPVVVVLRPGDLTAEEAEQHAALEGQQEPGIIRHDVILCVMCHQKVMGSLISLLHEIKTGN